MEKYFLPPRGTADILPLEVPLWEEIENMSRRILRIYNYKEIRTPIFEETELFARSMGSTSDVVQKQMLNLAGQNQKDAEGEKSSGLSLRPENTASVVRAYIQNSFDKKEQLSKLFYIGPMFRGERPQKGRLRQFHQIGVEAIGPNSASAYLDAEVIALSVNLLKSFGLKDFKVKINTLGSEEDKSNFSKILREKIKPYFSDLSEDSQQRFERNVFRILDSKDKKDKDVIAKIDIKHSYLSEESRKYYEDVKAVLTDLGVDYEESDSLVRGLDYYTHTVFEITGTSLGSQDALGAGGRYNNLVENLGGSKVDAIGFALGIERILLALSQNVCVKETPIDIFIIALGENAAKQAFKILNELRNVGYSSDMSYKASSLKSQMRLADKFKARFVIIIGEDELNKNIMLLRNMETGEQKELALERYLEILGEIIKQ